MDFRGHARVPSIAIRLFAWLSSLPVGCHSWRPAGVNVSRFGARSARQLRVLDAFLHGWHTYRDVCWGKDELLPVARRCSDEFGGTGAQIVDALDSLLIMDLQDEYHSAVEWVIQNFTSAIDSQVSVFETTIRLLGGLLSAHFLAGDPELLRQAKLLGRRLLPAWREGPIPYELVNLLTGEVGQRDKELGSSLAEVGTVQLEFTALSASTGDPSYRWRGEHVMDLVGPLLLEGGGLLPIMLRPSHPLRWTNMRVTLGGRGDSFYEYLLKQWLQTNRTEERYRTWYRAAARGIRRALVGRSSPSGLAFVREVTSPFELEPWLHEPNNSVSWNGLAESLKETSQPVTFVLQVVEAEEPEEPQTAGEDAFDDDEASDGGSSEAASLYASRGQAGEQERVLDDGSCEVTGEGPEANNVIFTDTEGEVSVIQLARGNRLQWSASGVCYDSKVAKLTWGASQGMEAIAAPDTGLLAHMTDPVSGEARDALLTRLVQLAESAGVELQGFDRFQRLAEQAAADIDDQAPVDQQPPDLEDGAAVCNEPPSEQPSSEAGGLDGTIKLSRLLQQLLGGRQGGLKQIFAMLPALPGEELCPMAEQVKAEQWDMLIRRLEVKTPHHPGGLASLKPEMMRHIIGMLSKHLDQLCQNWGRFKMDHLACFLPGLLALGSMTGAAEDAAADLALAGELVEGCARMWLDSPTGLAPESSAFNVVPGRADDVEVIHEAAFAILRPETVESLWYLFVATGNTRYQDLGWRIFEAIETHGRVEEGGYSGVEDVRQADSPKRRDRMETFLLSETFKYLFLLFAEEQPFDLKQVVLNTEGHPLPVVSAAAARGGRDATPDSRGSPL